MKNLWIISVMFLFSMIFLITSTGCKKESGTTSSLPTGSMNANIGGSAFNSVACSISGNTITAINGSNAIITIKLNSGPSLDTTLIDSSGKKATAYYISGSLSEYATSGYVEITELKSGDNCTGKFEFTCVDGTVVRHGAFTAVFK